MHYQSFKGTAKEWEEAQVKVNGKLITQPMLSIMSQIGVAKILGEVPRPKGKKGHPEKIYQIVGKSGLKVEFNSDNIEFTKGEIYAGV